eukprot:CAMPEP_0176007738 /NCGR_PEP_ID=MMETSP0120_2-20121206/3385_1 /TAXON_ID=160619 /ORGANISM="Kryptoperidinium foliaceum, Strain CCMP 1326" /LENGTH=55 /DNA_ID=CAMNT_0017340503 /DNA_START=157 /DNA_END=321 /DNA_ORIENTATION=+
MPALSGSPAAAIAEVSAEGSENRQAKLHGTHVEFHHGKLQADGGPGLLLKPGRVR